MNNINLLMNDIVSDEEKREAAKNVIIIYDLPLSEEQILLAFKKVVNCNNTIFRNKKIYINNRIFLFEKVLDVNKNMFIAIILALCNNFNPRNLLHFIIFEENGPNDIGMSMYWTMQTINYYKVLLDHYNFDVSDMPNIPKEHKQKIQAYHTAKYSGNLTKCAIKKN